jgi:hypothetical protein
MLRLIERSNRIEESWKVCTKQQVQMAKKYANWQKYRIWLSVLFLLFNYTSIKKMDFFCSKYLDI